MAKVVVFGTRDLAQLAKYYLDTDSVHKVVAFTVNEQYMPETCQFEGLPIVPFEEVTKYFSPADYSFFAPMPRRICGTSSLPSTCRRATLVMSR